MFSPLTHDDPHQLGAYRLMARLGSGGMGTVYLARSSSGRTAALKTMHARIATDPAFRTRFRLEVDAARVIGGVHGAQVFDADPLSDTPWLATEYILGPPLDDAVVLAGSFPESAVRALGVALCQALAQLHASEVVHRDLKPSNIMLTADGPKVIDFGIARATGDDRLTRIGAAAGTPAFMSPEQATGQEHTSAGDVFALAGVLVHAATGHGPFGSGQPADLLYRVRYADPDLTGVFEALAAVLARGLSKAPADRPTTAELAAQLSTGTAGPGFAEHLPEILLTEITRRAAEVWHVQPHRLLPPADTLPEPSTDPVPPSLSRRKLLALGGGSVLGVTAAGTGAWAWLGRRSTKSGGTGTPNDGATSSASAAAKGDSLWRIAISTSKATIVPPVPLTYGGWIVVADDNGVRFIDAERGGVEFPSLSKAPSHQCVVELERVHWCELPPSADGALRIKSFDPVGGSLDPALVKFEDFNGSLPGTQLLCAEDGVVYLAAGQGKKSGEGIGFSRDQSWFLLAVDTHTLQIIWRRPLPRRPGTTLRLHFLDSRVEGEALVLLQETSDGKVRLSVRDSRTGNVRWEQPLAVSEPEDVRGKLAVDGGMHVYPPTGALRALSLIDGKEVWNFGNGRSRRTGPPTVTDSAVYAVEEGLGVVAVDSRTGELQWEEKGGRGADADLAAPPLAGYRNVYSKGPGHLRIIDIKTGRTSRSYKSTEDRFFAYESVVDDASRIVGMGEEFIACYPLD
ncbi:PQQ-binding-like beta-propeller repeat protein [Streptomyces sp. ISL-96]|uniref:serine/threonine-protein kinase n=1 Tax=Streptomyces sp. ISL-96 TaxID=2819191 RepID=UPI001BEA2FE8|nr:serine/threonine-protein kinase [Streptomyces sp. ISL-96]MBT2490914.1 PQQ-binding-like beta-propeller repeat protein [Streptomyces sp. ISL-96]